MYLIKEWSITWYAWLSQWGATFASPLMYLNDQISIPMLSAIVLGMVAALSPCQVSTNAAAMAYMSKDITRRNQIIKNTVLFSMGRIIMYSIIGISFILLGIQFINVIESVSLIVWVRKLLGPFMIKMYPIE